MGLCSEVADDGENLEDHPRPRDQIRPPQDPVSACKLPGKLVSGGVEPFSFGPDKILPGTLHHSGNTPAPPSDHIPLARRSAFQQGRKRGRRRNSAAPAGLKYLARRFCRAYARRSVFSMESWNFAVPLPFLRRSAGDSMNHKGVEYTLTRSQTPGVLAVAISDRRPGQVGIDRGTACAVGHAPRRAEN